MAVLVIGFINRKISWVCLQRSQCELQWFLLVAAINSPCFSSLFLAISIHLSFLVRMGLNQSRTIVQCLNRWKKLVAHPALPFLMRGALSSWGVPSWSWTILAWGMGWCWQTQAVFLLFSWDYSQVFCFTVLLKFLNRILELSQICFCLW